MSYNAREPLRICLRSVSGEGAREVVVVDNASGDRSAEMVAAEFPEVLLRRNKVNVGYGAAANQGVAHCTAPYVLLINCDTCLEPGAVSALADYLDEHAEVGLVGPRLVSESGSSHPSCFPFPSPLDFLLDVTNMYRLLGFIPYIRDRVLRTWRHTEARAVPWVSGAAIAVRRSAFERLGGFDESFFMYAEEVDLCYRLERAGWSVHFAPVATVAHIGGASTRQQREDMLVQMYASQVRFYELHYSSSRRFQLLAIIVSMALGRLARDWCARRIEVDPERRTILGEQIDAWRRLVRGGWRHGCS